MTANNSFHKRLTSREREANSLLCVGLDPVVEKLPKAIPATTDGIADFCIQIIEATKDLVSSYKPNLPFFLSLGEDGAKTLRRVREAIPADIPMILDCKVNDLGDTARAWVETAFDYIEADAIVVAPYMGEDALAPYFNQDGKGVIVLVKTSNPGSGDLQDLPLENGQPLFMHVAERCRGMEHHLSRRHRDGGWSHLASTASGSARPLPGPGDSVAGPGSTRRGCRGIGAGRGGCTGWFTALLIFPRHSLRERRHGFRRCRPNAGIGTSR